MGSCGSQIELGVAMQSIVRSGCGRSKPHYRRGLATLETVMSFPPLIALAAILLAIGSASVRKVDTVVVARHRTWSHRIERPGTPFPYGEIAKEMMAEKSEQLVSMPPGLASLPSGASSVTAISRNHIHVDPWDDRPSSFSSKAPHLSPMFLMATSGVLSQFDLQNTFSKFDASDGGAMMSLLEGEVGSVVTSQLAGLGGSVAKGLAMPMADPVTKKLIEPLADSLFHEFDDFFGQIGKLGGANGGSMTSMAEGLNQLLSGSGATMDTLAGKIDPSQIFNKVIEKIPEPFRKLAKLAISSSDSDDLLGKAVSAAADAAQKAADEAEKAKQAAGKVVDDAADKLKLPGGGKKESKAEKALKKVPGLIKDANKLVKTAANSLKMIDPPIRNLRAASKGDVGTDDSDSSGFREQIESLEETLMELKSVLDSVKDALSEAGIT